MKGKNNQRSKFLEKARKPRIQNRSRGLFVVRRG